LLFRLSRRLEELDRVTVQILQLNLFAAGAGFHLVAEAESRFLQHGDSGRKIGDFKNDAVPPARLLLATARLATETWANCRQMFLIKLEPTEGAEAGSFRSAKRVESRRVRSRSPARVAEG
jgi:hypothetical protein